MVKAGSSKKPVVSVAVDLTNLTEADLLVHVSEILSALGDITPQQQTELEAIDNELARRDSLKLGV